MSSSSTSGTAAGRIDTHFHALPPAYLDALNHADGDPSGYVTPKWSIEAALEGMKKVGTTTAILSVSAPGVSIAGTGPAARTLCRDLNHTLARYAASHPGRIGFFGVLPDWCDVDGTLAELDFLYNPTDSNRPRCVGVTVFTSYGGRLLGDARLAPIWARLNEYGALLFVHPCVLDVTPAFVAGKLPQPVVDYPLATTRAAVDLVASGTLRRCPSVDVILSHAGGALPFLGARAVMGLEMPAMAGRMEVRDGESLREDFGRFYYDLALSTSAAQLGGLLDWAGPEKVVFGSDYPYVPQEGIDKLVDGYEKWVEENPRGKMLAPEVLRRNSEKLLAKHGFVL